MSEPGRGSYNCSFACFCVSARHNLIKKWWCSNYIQQCSIVQLCILRRLEAFCMPDIGGHVISWQFLRSAQLYNMLAVCNFTARAWIMLHSPHAVFFCINSFVNFFKILFLTLILNKIILKVIIMNECCLWIIML